QRGDERCRRADVAAGPGAAGAVRAAAGAAAAVGRRACAAGGSCAAARPRAPARFHRPAGTGMVSSHAPPPGAALRLKRRRRAPRAPVPQRTTSGAIMQDMSPNADDGVVKRLRAEAQLQAYPTLSQEEVQQLLHWFRREASALD